MKWDEFLEQTECRQKNLNIYPPNTPMHFAIANILLNDVPRLTKRVRELEEALSAAIYRIDFGHFHLMDTNTIKEALSKEVEE